MPLPRVAYVSSGAARPPAASTGYDPTQAAKLTRNMRGDTTKDQMGSLLFPAQPNQASHMPVPKSNAALYGTSVDHPLHVAGVVAINRPPEVADRLRPSGASQMQQQHKAGQLRQRGESAYSVITGGSEAEPKPFVPGRRAPPRTAYEHPTYRIGRSMAGSDAKDAMYGGYEPQAPPPQQRQEQQEQQQQEEDPGMAFLRRLKGAYDHLAEAMPSVAREALTRTPNPNP